jgi:hypothetical protein
VLVLFREFAAMSLSRRSFALALASVAAAIAAGCASTSIQSTWSDPAYTGGPFKTYFVMGLSERSVGARRVFEDTMVARLKAAGAQAVPAYAYLDGDGPANERAIDAAIAKAGADAVLMARLVGIDSRVNVSTAMVPGPVMGPGFGWYGMYSGWYAVPQVTQYQIAVVETSVFEVRTKKLVWTATSETFNPQSIQKEAPGFADVLVKALGARGLVPAKG